MKLKPFQWLWMIATGVFFIAALLDIGGVIQIPVAVLIIVPVVIALVSWVAGPSLEELRGVNQRG